MNAVRRRVLRFGTVRVEPNDRSSSPSAPAKRWPSWITARTAIAGSALFAIVLAVALGPQLWQVDPNSMDLARGLAPPFWMGGSMAHPLGTDDFGRDILARVLAGGRVSLAVTGLSLLGALAIGVPAGIAAGYFGGVVDAVISRLVDVQLAFPPFLLGLAVVSGLPPGTGPLLGILVLTGWVQYARLLRGQVLVLKRLQFVEASRGLGAGKLWIMRDHLLPNTWSTTIVVSTFIAAQMIILEAALSFLGVGIQPPTPSWGGELQAGLTNLATAWWLATCPGVALMVTILVINLLGDGLRDALNPLLRS